MCSWWWNILVYQSNGKNRRRRKKIREDFFFFEEYIYTMLMIKYFINLHTISYTDTFTQMFHDFYRMYPCTHHHIYTQYDIQLRGNESNNKNDNNSAMTTKRKKKKSLEIRGHSISLWQFKMKIFRENWKKVRF